VGGAAGTQLFVRPRNIKAAPFIPSGVLGPSLFHALKMDRLLKLPWVAFLTYPVSTWQAKMLVRRKKKGFWQLSSNPKGLSAARGGVHPCFYQNSSPKIRTSREEKGKDVQVKNPERKEAAGATRCTGGGVKKTDGPSVDKKAKGYKLE